MGVAVSENFPGRDEIEIYKPFMEIAKYSVAVVSAFAALTAAIVRSVGITIDTEMKVMVCVCLAVNICVFLLSHRVFSEASALVTTKQESAAREQALGELKSGPYSLFVIFYISSLILWTGLLGWVVVAA